MRCWRQPSLLVAILMVMVFAPCANPATENDYMVLPGPSGLLPSLPDAVVDLRKKAGADLLAAQWRFRETKISETRFREPGPDLGPSGEPNRATTSLRVLAWPVSTNRSQW